MKKYLIISFLLVQVNALGQIYVKIDEKQTNEGYEISIINDNSIDTADIDNDCIIDTIRYDNNAGTYVAILSSQKSKPVYINNLGYEWFYDETFISAEKGGLSVNSTSMRSSNQMTYKYENSTKRLRLSEISNESMGNTGRGIEKIDFINNKFIADWYYFDDDMDEIIGIPTFEINIDSKPIFSDDTITDTYIKSYINSDSLYYQNKCKNIIDERCKRIDAMNLLKMKMPVVEPENINDENVDSAYYLIYEDKKYQPTKTLNDDSKKDIADRITKLKQHKGVNPFLIRFYQDDFFYVLYINKSSSMDALYLGKGKTLAECNIFEIDDDYTITLKKENKTYGIDTRKCKFIEK